MVNQKLIQIKDDKGCVILSTLRRDQHLQIITQLFTWEGSYLKGGGGANLQRVNLTSDIGWPKVITNVWNFQISQKITSFTIINHYWQQPKWYLPWCIIHHKISYIISIIWGLSIMPFIIVLPSDIYRICGGFHFTWIIIMDIKFK